MDKMIESISSYKSQEELETLKHQLFMENVRLQAEKGQIEQEYDDIHKERKLLISERKQLQREKKQLSIELNQLREQVEYERKRLKDDEKLIEKKLKIVEKSYEILEQDKNNIKLEYSKIEAEKERLRRVFADHSAKKKEVYAHGIFFRGVNNLVALKKRYKELLKIYHPDNICGDNEILLKINEEYEDLRSRFDISRNA